MSDRLDEIKRRFHATKVQSEHTWLEAQGDIDWLIGEVERLRDELSALTLAVRVAAHMRHEAKLDADGGQVVTPEK